LGVWGLGVGPPPPNPQSPIPNPQSPIPIVFLIINIFKYIYIKHYFAKVGEKTKNLIKIKLIK
jgi:hypothetical protein